MSVLNIYYKKRVQENYLNNLYMAISSGIANANITVINVILDTNGGEAYDAFKFYHNFRKLKHNIEINVYAESKVYSAGIFIYLAFSSRYCLNNTDFMIHAVNKRGASTLDRKAVDLNNEAARILNSNTNITLATYTAIVNAKNNQYYNPNQALAQNICHTIAAALPQAVVTINI